MFELNGYAVDHQIFQNVMKPLIRSLILNFEGDRNKKVIKIRQIVLPNRFTHFRNIILLLNLHPRSSSTFFTHHFSPEGSTINE